MTADVRAYLLDLAKAYYLADEADSYRAFGQFWEAAAKHGVGEREREAIADEAEAWWQEDQAKARRLKP